MKIKNYITPLLVASSLGLISMSGYAAPMNAESKSTINTVSVNQHKGKGKILAIDKKAQKIKLAHGPIKSLNWGAMKMFFAVENKDLVDEVKVGDTVNFSFIKSNDGRFIIVDMN